ncbi:MAG TPA: alpha/beta fold hydrolase [Streptosporangiaceae bacterium]|nr:alpha/beta fold hydrolase [Streptosporangiaceae bacterium]
MIGSAPAATSLAPDQFAAPWGARGYVTELGGPVHWVEFSSSLDLGSGSGPGTYGPPVVFVHGLGGSHLNWCLVGPQLAAGRRAVALDLAGFGLTPGTRHTATVRANARLLDRFVRQIIGTAVILVGNSMGGTISVLQTAAAPETVAGVVLIDPALPVPRRAPDPLVAGQFLLFMLPGLGELFVRTLSRRAPEQAVRQLIELNFADPSRADPAMVAASTDLARRRRDDHAGARARDQSLLAASRSLLRVIGRQRRYWEMTAGIEVPVLLIGGESDRLVPIAAMRQAAARNPRWETAFLAGAGHVPQLEVPAVVTGTVSDWLDRHFPGRNGHAATDRA